MQQFYISYKTTYTCDFMNYVGKSKISKLSPKANIQYPLVRLPQSCGDSIGKTASIYETEHEGNRAYLIVLDDNAFKNTKVIQQNNTKSYECRLSEV